MKFRGFPLVLLGFAHLLLCDGVIARGSPRASSTPHANTNDGAPDGRPKRVIALSNIATVKVAQPDGSVRDVGQDIQARLSTKISQSSYYVLADEGIRPQDAESQNSALKSGLESPPIFVWPGTFVPAARMNVRLEEVSLVTGERGNRVMYGFDQRSKNRFHTIETPEIFGLNEEGEDAFENAFSAYGRSPADSRSGLDIGDSIGLNIVFAFFRVQYARYQAALQLTVDIEEVATQAKTKKRLHVQAGGLYLDVAGGYLGYSGAIAIARTDAMQRAIQNAVDKAWESLDQQARPLKSVARIDGVLLNEGKVLLGVGKNAQAPVGTVYKVQGSNDLLLRVVSSQVDGSVASVAAGDPNRLKVGQLVIESEASATGTVFKEDLAQLQKTNSQASDLEQLVALDETLEPSNDFNQVAPKESYAQAYLKSLLEGFLLPYRLWRYGQYDQRYRPSGSVEASLGPIVAVVDSGVDYNHPALKDNIWINPNPETDLRNQSDRYGWDFVSADGRAYDDHGHGTWVAGAVLRANPQTRIMPIKVVNPFGLTRGDVIYAGVRYAVDHGAHVVVLGWASPKESQAIRSAVGYALMKNVMVVVASGDQGVDLDIQRRLPALLGKGNEKVLVVSSLQALTKKTSNFGSSSVDVTVELPEEKLPSPRKRKRLVQTSAAAAGYVAGTLARWLSQRSADSTRTKSAFIEELTRQDTSLLPWVRGGRVLLR